MKTAWTLFGVDEKTQQDNVRNAFQYSSGFQVTSCFQIYPRENGLGVVVMLRSMWSIMASDLYATEQNARINDRPMPSTA